MVQECVTLLQAAGSAGRKVFVDATFGAGGHSAALLEAVSDSRIVAIDADPNSIGRAHVLARRFPGRITAAQGNYGSINALLDAAGVGQIDGVLYDLGISSLQLAAPERGFSFTRNERLDMRLDPGSGSLTASDLLQTLPQPQLESILRDFGDERRARAIARAIVRRRQRIHAWMTDDLLAAVWSALPKDSGRRRGRIHPATRTFQALRMAVNGDLDNLQRSLRAAAPRLTARGRIVAISFHSGEDRTIKNEFKAFEQAGAMSTLTRKPLRPAAAELRANVRSRSAKLRASERVNAAAAQSGGTAAWR